MILGYPLYFMKHQHASYSVDPLDLVMPVNYRNFLLLFLWWFFPLSYVTIWNNYHLDLELPLLSKMIISLLRIFFIYLVFLKLWDFIYFIFQNSYWCFKIGHPLKNVERNGRDLSVVKSTCCSCWGARSSAQHPHGSSSQPPIIPVPGNSMLPSDLCKHQACMRYTYIHTGKAFVK